MTLPELQSDETVPERQRPVVFAAVIGGGIALFAVVLGLTLLGWHSENNGEVVATGLTSIGATLAGGFAGWIARGRNPGGGA
jgi:hypothetical protein